jgi:hypothetical protein
VGSPIGTIIDIEDRRAISTSLTHPHTLVSVEEKLFVLGSFSGSVERVHQGGERTVCAKYPGYLRGVSFFEGGAIVGVSGRRRRSRGLGTTNVAGPDFDHRCGILWFSHDWEVIQFVDLTWFGREIFDLMVLEVAPIIPTPSDTLAAAKHRSLQLDASWQAPPGGPVPPGSDSD